MSGPMRRPGARKTLDDLPIDEIRGRIAFVRVDFNCPLETRGGVLVVSSDARIRATLPTIHALLDRGCRVLLASHLGRPEDRDPDLSLAPVAERLETLIEQRLEFVADPIDDGAEERVRSGSSPLMLLENLRYDEREAANDPGFASLLAALADFFVQDAFGTCHRAHASTVGVAQRMGARVAGYLVDAELDAFDRLSEADGPFAAILGGAKIAGKLDIVRALADRCDRVCLGGGMANTFLLARGVDVGDSLVEPDCVEEARTVLSMHEDKIVLPTDVVVATEIASDADHETVSVDAVPHGWKILDVGAKSVEAIGSTLDGCRKAFWNGPVGVFETSPFDRGTLSVARRLAAATDAGAFTVTGGGDSIAALEKAGLVGGVSHASTGGGAALERVADASLPGIEVLDRIEKPGDGRLAS